MHRDELGAVREGRLDLHVVDHRGDAFHHLARAHDPCAIAHQFGVESEDWIATRRSRACPQNTAGSGTIPTWRAATRRVAVGEQRSSRDYHPSRKTLQDNTASAKQWLRYGGDRPRRSSPENGAPHPAHHLVPLSARRGKYAGHPAGDWGGILHAVMRIAGGGTQSPENPVVSRQASVVSLRPPF